jgi:hypothetical protein
VTTHVRILMFAIFGWVCVLARVAAGQVGASTQASDGRFIGALSNGVGIEILGLNENPNDGKPWWRPDGQVLNAALDTSHAPMISESPVFLRRKILVRTQYPDAKGGDPAHMKWSFEKEGGEAFSLTWDAELHEIPSVNLHSFLLPDDPNGATLVAKVAAGPWETIGTCNGDGPATDSAKGVFVTFGRAYRVDQEIHMIVIASLQPDVEERLVAVGSGGRQITLYTYRRAQGGAGAEIAEFSVPAASWPIRQWQLQTRPYDQWIKIQNISLHRGRLTQVQITTSDDAAPPPSPAR